MTIPTTVQRLRALLPLVRRPATDRTLVVTILPEGARASLVYLDPERTMRIEHTWESFLWDEVVPDWLPPARVPRVVVAFHPSLVVPTEVPVTVHRTHPDVPLSQEELETMLRQLHVQLWNEHRIRAAEQLGVDPIEAVLLDLQISALSVDGREIVQPLELTGAELTLRVLVRFGTRTIFDRWRGMLSRSDDTFITDLPTALTYAIADTEYAGAGVLLCTPTTTTYAGTRLYRRVLTQRRVVLDWRVGDLVAHLSRLWRLPSDGTIDLYVRYIAQRFSSRVQAAVSTYLAPAVHEFDQRVRTARLRGTAVCVSELPLPFTLPATRAGLHLVSFPLVDALAVRDVRYEASDAMTEHDAHTVCTLAAVLESYYHTTYATTNQWLKRRIHWLMPATV